MVLNKKLRYVGREWGEDLVKEKGLTANHRKPFFFGGARRDRTADLLNGILGAVYGLGAIPAQWVDRVLNCRPKAGNPGVHRPRPECFWPVDALELAERLVNWKMSYL
jgi:hypothetical protein